MIQSAYTTYTFIEVKCLFTTVNKNVTIAVQFVSSFIELSLFSGLPLGGKQFTEKLQIHNENKKK